MELLPHLLLRLEGCDIASLIEVYNDDENVGNGSEFRDSVLKTLTDLPWSREFLLQFMRVFRGFPLNDFQQRYVCSKILNESSRELSQIFSSKLEGDNAQDIPLIYFGYLSWIARTSEYLSRRLLMRQIVFSLEELSKKSITSQKPSSITVSCSTAKEIIVIQATILFHWDASLNKDASLVPLLLNELEATQIKLSPMQLGLLLVAARQLKYQESIMLFLSRYIMDSYSSCTTSRSPSPHPDDNDVTKVGRRRVFLDVISYAQQVGGWEHVIQSTVELGFYLMKGSLRKKRSRGDINSTISIGPINCERWMDFGVRIILWCFQAHESVREDVIDRISTSIVINDPQMEYYLKLLAWIAQRHASTSEFNSTMILKLCEAMEYLTFLSLQRARLFLAALAPFLQVSKELKSDVISALRKAMFKKDVKPRIIGVVGLSYVLRLSSQVFRKSRTRGGLTQLYSQYISSTQGDNPGSAFSLSQRGQDCAQGSDRSFLDGEELFRQFCGIFKRVLSLQSTVRIVLYEELGQIFRECPLLRQGIMELILSQYTKYYDSNESILLPLKLDKCLSRDDNHESYDEPIPFLLKLMIDCLDIENPNVEEDHLDRSIFHQATKGLEALCERLMRCDLEDYDLNKPSSFALNDALGRSNRKIGELLMGVAEICIGNLTKNSRTCDRVFCSKESWTSILRLYSIYHTVQMKLYKEKSTESKKHKVSSKFTKQSEYRNASQPYIICNENEDNFSRKCFCSVNPRMNFCASLLNPDAIIYLLRCMCQHLSTSESPSEAINNSTNFMFYLFQKVEGLLSNFATTLQYSNLLRIFYNGKNECLSRFSTTEHSEQIKITRDIAQSLVSIYAICKKSVMYSVGIGEDHCVQNRNESKGVKGTSNTQIALSEDAHLSGRKVIGARCFMLFQRTVDIWLQMGLGVEMEKLVESALDSLSIDVKQDEPEHLRSWGIPYSVKTMQDLLIQAIDGRLDDEAKTIIGIIRILCLKLLPVSAKTFTSWMEQVLTEKAAVSSSLVEACLDFSFFAMRGKCRSEKIVCDVDLWYGQRLSQGLISYCNSNRVIDFNRSEACPVNLSSFTEKSAGKLALVVLRECDRALCDLESVKKGYDDIYRRNIAKSTFFALQTPVFQEETATNNSSSQPYATRLPHFKKYCHVLYDLCGVLLPFLLVDLNKEIIAVRVIRMIIRVYKLLIATVNILVRTKDSSLPKYIQRLFDRSAAELSPTLLQFVACIHEENKRYVLEKSRKGIASRPNSSIGIPQGTTRIQSKLVPEAVFQVEQFDSALIKLSKICKVSMMKKLLT
jgi:hypothetical protein